MRKNKCCKKDCGKPATWEITDQGEKDPYQADTYSCDEHISDNIGSIPPTEPKGPWLLTPYIVVSKQEWKCLECGQEGSYADIRKPLDSGVDKCPNCSEEVTCLE